MPPVVYPKGKNPASYGVTTWPSSGVVTPGNTPPSPPRGGRAAVPGKGKLDPNILRHLYSGARTKTPPLAFDPTKGWPTSPALTAYPTLDTSTLPDGSEVPNSPAHAFKPGTAQLLDPSKFADMVGAKSYAPLIAALTQQQGRLGSGVADANSMLNKSYGDAAAGSLRGAQIVSDSNAKANQSLTDLAARMAQAVGGDPTAAAAVGQTTANQQSADTRFADVAAQGQADQAAAAQRDLGTAKLAYKGTTDKAIADLATAVGQAKAQGSQAQGKALEEALGFNSSQQTAQQGRDTAKQEAWLAGQLAGPQITAGNLANDATRLGLKKSVHDTAVNDWTAQTASTQQQWLNRVKTRTDALTAQQMKAAMVKGQTPVVELALADPTGAGAAVTAALDHNFRSKAGPIEDPAKTYRDVVQQLTSSYGSTSSKKAVMALAQQYADSQIAAWNANHGNKFKVVNGVPVRTK